jgi:hypothetical protein
MHRPANTLRPCIDRARHSRVSRQMHIGSRYPSKATLTLLGALRRPACRTACVGSPLRRLRGFESSGRSGDWQRLRDQADDGFGALGQPESRGIRPIDHRARYAFSRAIGQIVWSTAPRMLRSRIPRRCGLQLVRAGGESFNPSAENELDGLRLGGGQFPIATRDNGAVRMRKPEGSAFLGPSLPNPLL